MLDQSPETAVAFRKTIAETCREREDPDKEHLFNLSAKSQLDQDTGLA